MALTMWGQLIVQAATPGEDPVQIGTLWVDTTSTPVVKVCTAISPYTFATASGGVSDGDKGDITVSGSGGTFTIDNNVVTPAKMDDGAAVSVLGRSANSAGDRADIAASANDQILRRRSDVVGFGTLIAADIPAGSAVPTEETTTSTGTVNNFDLNARFTYLRCNNASALVFTGFTTVGAAPVAGDTVIVDNVGSSTMQVLHQNAGSTAANRIITPSVAGQIIGAGGRIIGVYDATTSRWRITCIDPGSPIVWTPTDTSGAALAFTSVSAAYQQRGNNVFVRWILKSPSTADATAAKIGSLPFTILGEVGFGLGFTACPTPMYIWGASGTTDMSPIKQAGGANLTNVDLSLSWINGSGNYNIA